MARHEVPKNSWAGLEIEIVGKDAYRVASVLDLGGTAVKQLINPTMRKKRTIIDMLREVGINGR